MRIRSLNAGQPREYSGGPQEAGGGPSYCTAIFKEPVRGPIELTTLNFAGDRQADLVNHGGPEKAVNAYFYTHYAYWERELGITLPTAAFGENITLTDADEGDVCIGDVYNAGTAVLQACQPRIPCFKLARKLGVADMVKRVTGVGFTGFYFRVLTPGQVGPGDELTLVRRPNPDASISEANRVFHHDRHDHAGIRRLLAAEGLATVWREMLIKRLAKG